MKMIKTTLMALAFVGSLAIQLKASDSNFQQIKNAFEEFNTYFTTSQIPPLKEATEEEKLLFTFIEKKNVKAFRELFTSMLNNKKVDVNKEIENSTFLGKASYQGLLELVKYLIENGADVNQIVVGETALTFACEEGFLEIVKVLIENGADVNQITEDKTALTVACKEGHIEIVKHLIENGAKVNQDVNGKTALKTACKKGLFKILKLLIENGADVNQIAGDETALRV